MKHGYEEKLSFQNSEICDNPCSSVAFFFGFFERSPNIAVPTRTSVAPSSTATEKSLVIPMERCGSLRLNSFFECVAKFAQLHKIFRDAFRFLRERRNAHKSLDR